MLSVLVCSINDELLRQVKQNIADTVGVPYELLVWDNKASNDGICNVYNRLANDAQYPLLLFVHEDVTFQTMNWGQKLVQKFGEDDAVGLIGVAGSRYKGKMYSGWYTSKKEMDMFNIIHTDGKHVNEMHNRPDSSTHYHDAVCIDGVFMMCRKAVWEQIHFDEQLLKGFHFYDIDFSVRAAAVTKVMVVTDVTMVHHTNGGDYGDRWVKEAFVYHAAKAKDLPVSVGDIPTGFELVLAACWLDWLKDKPVSISNRIEWVLRQQLWKHGSLWYAIAKFMLYRPTGLQYLHRLIKK